MVLNKQESISPYLLSCVCLWLTKSRLIFSGLPAAFLVRHFAFDHLARCSQDGDALGFDGLTLGQAQGQDARIVFGLDFVSIDFGW